ncbi:MAG: DNA adenine methylase [Mangrovibacterium sp.]
MNTPITYYGGKQMMTKEIISMIPPHKIYCEPYFGGGAVFFAKPPSKIEVINDLNKKLINFYQICQTDFEKLSRMVHNTVHSETLFLIAKDIYNERTASDRISQAWAIWLISHTSFNGSFHGGWKWCNGSAGTNVARVLETKRNNFSDALFERLKYVQISARDAIRVIIDRDSPETFFYLDPPYPGNYQGHYTGFKMGEFVALLDVLSVIKGKFILSNYWSQSLRYYIAKAGWQFQKKTMHLGTNVNSDRIRKNVRRKTKKEEILIWNYEVLPNLFNQHKKGNDQANRERSSAGMGDDDAKTCL